MSLDLLVMFVQLSTKPKYGDCDYIHPPLAFFSTSEDVTLL